MKRLIVFIGSRSNYGRLEYLIQNMMNDFDVSIIIANTALNCHIEASIENGVVLRIDSDMYNDTVFNLSSTISNISNICSNFFMNNKFDIALCHGDRFETLGFAIASATCNLKLIHLESDEDSGNIDNKIRKAIDSLSDIKINHEEFGNPAIEYILKNKDKFKSNTTDYILINYNPSQTMDEDLSIILDIIKKYPEEIYYWILPNQDVGWKKISKIAHNHKILKNLNNNQYLTCLANCKLLIGNCSSGLKEGAALGIPYLLLGDRQKNRKTYNNIIRYNDIKEIITLEVPRIFTDLTCNINACQKIIERVEDDE